MFCNANGSFTLGSSRELGGLPQDKQKQMDICMRETLYVSVLTVFLLGINNILIKPYISIISTVI